VVVDKMTGERGAAACVGTIVRTSASRSARSIEFLLQFIDAPPRSSFLQVWASMGQLSRERNPVKAPRHAARLLESIARREYVGLVVVVGLITLAVVGMLQSLGALVEPLPLDASWYGDAAGEDERGESRGWGPFSPVAIGPAAPSIPRRGEPTRDVLDDPTAPVCSVRLLSHESRAPPAPLRHWSI